MSRDQNSSCFIFSQILRNWDDFQSQIQLYGFLKSYDILLELGQQLQTDANIKDQKTLKKVECQCSSRLIIKSSFNELLDQKTLPRLEEKYTHEQTEETSLRYYKGNESVSLIQSYSYLVNAEILEAKEFQINETNHQKENFQMTSCQGAVLIKQNQNFKFQKSMKLQGGGCGSSNVNESQSLQLKNQSSQGAQQALNQGSNKKVDQGQKILFTEEQKVYQEGLQLLKEGLSYQKMELVLQGIQTIQKNKLANINDPLVLINQFLEIISHKYTEGWSQLLKEQLVRNLPELMDMLLQKKEQNSSKSEDKNDFFISAETKKDLMLKIEAGLKLVNIKRIGGPELDFDLRYSQMILENIPDNKDYDYFGIFCKILKVAQWGVALSFGIGAIDTEAICIIKDFFVWGKGWINEKMNTKIILKLKALDILGYDLARQYDKERFVEFQNIVLQGNQNLRFRACYLLKHMIKNKQATQELVEDSCKLLEELCKDKE